MAEEKKFRLDENGEPAVSLCGKCNCMTKSVDIGECFKCGKCEATK